MFKIFNSLATFKNRTALVSENNSISYQDLIKKSDKINKTIRSKTVCLMIAQNNQNFIISYVAFLRKKKSQNHKVFFHSNTTNRVYFQKLADQCILLKYYIIYSFLIFFQEKF